MTKLKQAPLLEKYAQLMLEIKSLEAQRDVLKLNLVESFTNDGIEKVEHPAGTFSLSRTTSWTYSDKVKTMQEKLKVAQVKEQEKGIAKAVESRTIRFVPTKD